MKFNGKFVKFSGKFIVKSTSQFVALSNTFSYTSWTRYKELQNSFYSLKKSSCYAGYISCTYPEGIMDVVCKHSLMLMEAEKLIDPLPQPLEGRQKRQKRARKRKIGHALERV